jgi:hypothetical protein
MVEDVNATQKRLVLIVVVPTPRASLVVSENIQVALGIVDLMFYDTCGTPSTMVGGISQISFID